MVNDTTVKRKLSKKLNESPIDSLKSRSLRRELASCTEQEKEILADLREKLVDYLKEKEEDQDWRKKHKDFKKTTKKKNEKKGHKKSDDKNHGGISEMQYSIWNKLQGKIQNMMIESKK